jgi:L-fucose mutarotase/ribose pyranase (RbsD/FucU family)
MARPVEAITTSSGVMANDRSPPLLESCLRVLRLPTISDEIAIAAARLIVAEDEFNERFLALKRVEHDRDEMLDWLEEHENVIESFGAMSVDLDRATESALLERLKQAYVLVDAIGRPHRKR